SAKEGPAHQVIAWRLECTAPEQPREASEQTAATCEKVVGPLGRRSEAGHVGVQPPPEATARSVTQHLIRCRGTRMDPTAWLDELDGVSKRLTRNRRVVSRGVLVGPIVDLAASERLPIVHPLPADAAVAVVDQRGSRGGHGRIREDIKGPPRPV